MKTREDIIAWFENYPLLQHDKEVFADKILWLVGEVNWDIKNEIQKAVAYGMGIMCGAHNIHLDEKEVKAYAIDYFNKLNVDVPGNKRTAFNVLIRKSYFWGENVSNEGLIGALEEYVKLLAAELNEVVPIANNHGWMSSRVEEGNILRQKIKNLYDTAT